MIIKLLGILILFYVGYRVMKMFRRIKSRDVKDYRMEDTRPGEKTWCRTPFAEYTCRRVRHTSKK